MVTNIESIIVPFRYIDDFDIVTGNFKKVVIVVDVGNISASAAAAMDVIDV